MASSLTSSVTMATQKFMLDNKATSEDFSEARSKLYAMGIKTSYDEDRMIFSSVHIHRNNMSNVYAQECNGLVLERGSWCPLMVPARALRYNINTDEADKYLHQGLYHIYKAEDGTTFNMYYYNDEWCISTARGYRMNDTKWNDIIDFKQLITECLEHYSLTWDEFTAQLNKKHCYSFGFKHPQPHKFHGRNNVTHKLWFIQSVDLDEDSDNYMWSNDVSPIPAIKPQEVYELPVGKLRVLYKLASKALYSYTQDPNTEPCFGFILRSANYHVTKSHSDLYIESTLMRAIRQIWYDSKIINLCRNSNWNTDDAVTLNAYLDNDLYRTFLYLFQQYNSKFDRYAIIVNKLVNYMIVKCSSSRRLTPKEREALEIPIEYKSTADLLLTSFNNDQKYDISKQTPHKKRKALFGYVMDQSSLEYLMPLLSCNTPTSS